MSLKYNTYIILKSTLWISYVLFCIVNLFVVKYEYLVLSLFICFPIIRFSIMMFINNWYRLGYPKLLDWFRLATFVSLIVQFFLIFNQLNLSHFSVVFDTVILNNESVFDSLKVILVGLIFLNIGEKIIDTSTGTNTFFKITTFTIKKYAYFFAFSFFLILLEIGLSLSNAIGFGSVGATAGLSFVIMFVRIMNSSILVILSLIIFNNKIVNPKNIKSLFYLFFGAKIMLAFISGMKEEVIISLMFVLIPFIMNGKKINKITIATLSLLMLILYPLINNYRATIFKYPNKFQAFSEAAMLTLDNFFEDKYEEKSEEEKQSLVARYQGLKPLMFAMENEEKWVDFKNMNRYPYALVAWILPRFILPNKPSADTGVKLYKIVRKDNSPTNVAITPTTYGWSYFEGGIIFVGLSFFLYALVISLVVKYLNKDLIYYTIVYILLLTSMIKIESDIYFRIVGLCQLLVVVYFLKRSFISNENLKHES